MSSRDMVNAKKKIMDDLYAMLIFLQPVQTNMKVGLTQESGYLQKLVSSNQVNLSKVTF